jgi:hypothetical protein
VAERGRSRLIATILTRCRPAGAEIWLTKSPRIETNLHIELALSFPSDEAGDELGQK